MAKAKETVDMRDTPMPSEKSMKNLVSFSDLPEKERKELASKAGKASAKKRAYNRTFKEATKWALELPAIGGNPTVDRIKKQFSGLTNLDALAISVMARGIQEGDYKAFATLRDTMGEMPSQAINLKNDEPMKIEIEVI